MDDQLAYPSAERILRIIPEFSHWATVRVLRDRIGGDLSLRQLTALYVIRELAPNPGQLAQELQVTAAVVTGIVDRLERRGFVARSGDPADRRRIRLTCTEAGRAASLDAQATLARIISRRLREMSPDDLATLDQGLSLLEEVLTKLQGHEEELAG